MEDKFLYQLREQPNPEFVKSLRQKLTHLEKEPRWRLKVNFQSLVMNRKTRLIWLTAMLMVSLLAVITITPARAFITSLLTSIAGQSFEVTEDYPGDNHPGGETIIEPQVVSLVEALTLFPHDISMPTYVPNEFVLDEENVLIYTGENAGPFADTLGIQWKSNTGFYLTLYVNNHGVSTSNEIIAPDSIEEVILDNEHTAVLIRGGWDVDRKVWNNEMGSIRLRWMVDDLVYDLHGNVRNISVEQLIEIALSTID